MRIAKEGYYSGDPEKVLKARIDHVLTTMDYIRFQGDFEDVFFEINRKDK